MAKKKVSKKKSKIKKIQSNNNSKIKSKTLKKTKAIKKKSLKKVPRKKTASKKVSPKKNIITKSSVKKNVSQILFKVGDLVPDFQGDSTSGLFKLSNYKGKKVVLYFYPKDNTSGCTLEGHDFSNNLDKFKNKNAVVFGVSKDSIKSHHGFIQKQSYNHHLISDEGEHICQHFGVIKEKSMYGRSYLGIERSTFVIDETGRLIQEWRGVKVPGHVSEVLAKL